MTTEYVVLAKDTSGHWSELDIQLAATARDAIAACAEDEGTYVAVPVRSWTPTGLKVETVKRKVWVSNGDTPPPNKETT